MRYWWWFRLMLGCQKDGNPTYAAVALYRVRWVRVGCGEERTTASMNTIESELLKS
jgi:hypothetical protein